MPTASDYHNPPPALSDGAFAVVEDERRRREFARRLQEAMRQARLNQSELARRAAALLEAPMGRSSASGYMRAKWLPRPSHLRALAHVLRVDDAWLLPAGSQSVDAGKAPFSMDVTPDGKRALVRLEMELPLELAAEIVSLVNRAGSGGG